MACDEQRGGSWTRALHGIKVNEIHLCGDTTAMKMITKICHELEEDLTIKRYECLKPLQVEEESLRDLKYVQPVDCIVAFSRRTVYEIKISIVESTTYGCCIIYGSLPSYTRQRQAELFNEENNYFDILIATDAVGMGTMHNFRKL
ncbi:hypothetical protein ZOSMA_806G00020 [Zostera marina]|uniref:Uncharacterized protein n=2 Tax=Zostera marina TaxID=29655 RepID=A0A0K9NMI2_ZOSMR|nr:hypothetical protein ZOSMA_806G00020 [Zostera marina]